MSDALNDLLRKCHRDELLPLAAVLHVDPDGKALHDLATEIGDTLRRRAANGVANTLFRRGQGPDYTGVLQRVGRHLGIRVSADPAEAEQQIVAEQVRQTWGSLSEAERGLRWARTPAPPPAPEGGDEAMTQLAERHPRGLGYWLGQLLRDPPVPLPGVFLVAWWLRPRFERVLPAVLEVARLRQGLRHRVTVGVVGSPSSGKDAAIAALFGIDTGNVNPVAGSTKAVEILEVAGPTALYVVNTPGLGDVVQAVTEAAQQVLHHIDVYLYVINAQGGVQAREKADYDACVASGRPVLAVVNKIDTLRLEDRVRYLADARDKLGAPADDFLAVAFDPLPQLAEAPIGVAAVQAWLSEHLEALGKDPEELPWANAPRRT